MRGLQETGHDRSSLPLHGRRRGAQVTCAATRGGSSRRRNRARCIEAAGHSSAHGFARTCFAGAAVAEPAPVRGAFRGPPDRSHSGRSAELPCGQSRRQPSSARCKGKFRLAVRDTFDYTSFVTVAGLSTLNYALRTSPELGSGPVGFPAGTSGMGLSIKLSEISSLKRSFRPFSTKTRATTPWAAIAAVSRGGSSGPLNR